jgi:NAD(P)-dependent dehydrogenase (short-subunit alcohol dehydrogenase family)
MRTLDVDRKRVLVVGGSTGIGLAVAQRLTALGAHTTVLARRRAALERALAALECVRRHPAQRLGFAEIDVRDPGVVGRVLGGLVASDGAPDVLVNCAGRAYPRRFEEIGYEQLMDTLQTNLVGCWNTVAAVVPAMKERGGYIVNTASLAGLIGVYGYTDYCASKFGLIGFSEALRSELKPFGIMVSVLCPPDTDTPGFATENTTKPPETHAVSAGTTLLTPDQVAAALLAGMARRMPVIVPGLEGRVSALAKRWWPGLVERVMDRAVARARR